MRRAATLAAAALALAGLGARADAASLVLAPREREEAVRAGQRSVTSETFGGEWRVLNGSGESVTVITPFHRLALAARHAAFRNESLKPSDANRALGEVKDTLMLWVHLYGSQEDFARYLRPRLVLGDREIGPAMVQNERTAVRQDTGRYLARCVYWFPVKELTGRASPALVVRDPEDRLVARFSIDLGKMR
ncbi:MAG: hypothetical protein HY728_07640 [Candidatus Rokubacteria bacterium]|nr:hypothetical protein [Candidatus Rokubacteria bacterium]MBI4594074.1 hypothetical protein [Candidatus Rokubacteria bacterium]